MISEFQLRVCLISQKLTEEMQLNMNEMIPLAECGDQRSTRKEKINESCECQPCLVIACLKVENSIEEE